MKRSIVFGEAKQHADKLKRGLKRLGSAYVAEICFWCDGKGTRKFEHCHVCGAGKFYGTALGLLINNKPAPDSVVNQVLLAAEAAD
jgi:hypothetical protein